MNAIETNVIAYSVDADAGDKRLRALHLLDGLDPEDTVLPWQVICEAGAVLTRLLSRGRSHADPAEVGAALTARFHITMPSPDLVLRGLRLRANFQVSCWDALLRAACSEAGVTRLYTEDLQSKPVIDGIELLDPFKSAP